MNSSGQQPAGGQSSEQAVLQMLEGVIANGAGQAAGSGNAQPTGAVANNPMLGPIVNSLAQRMHIPPALAETVVAFAIGQLISGKTGAPAPGTGKPAAVDPNSLLQRVTSGQGVDPNYLHSTGMPQQLANQTGMDTQTATASLQHTLQMLGSTMGGMQQI